MSETIGIDCKVCGFKHPAPECSDSKVLTTSKDSIDNFLHTFKITLISKLEVIQEEHDSQKFLNELTLITTIFAENYKDDLAKKVINSMKRG